MTTDRRTALADAAIGVLADEGMRGLTHRAVDRAADLPPGTTSAYFRTRAALLTALVRRLVQLDQDELQLAGERIPAPRNADELTDAIAALVSRRLTGDGRRRSLARYACAVESARDPELREILVPRDNAARDAVAGFLAAHATHTSRTDAGDVESRTLTLLACVDGLVFDRLVSGGHVPREAIRGLVAGALGGEPEPSRRSHRSRR